jgi:cyclophilin family peptidyl-prolyl cis-trans isomerase
VHDSFLYPASVYNNVVLSHELQSFMTKTADVANAALNNSIGVFFLMFSRLILLALASFALIMPAQIVNAQTTVAPAAVDQENILHLDLSTGGRVSIIMFSNVAPAHVERIKTLARRGFYNNLTFHRVIEGFMAQTGDPTGTGTGSSDLPDLTAEFSAVPHLRGTVSMARATDPNSANSQFFICFQPKFSLDNNYTVFGRVIAGMPHVDAIARGEPPAQPDRILQASIAADNIAPPDFANLPKAVAAEQPKFDLNRPLK